MTTEMCQWCGKRPAAFDTGSNGAEFLQCEPCAKRDGLVKRGEVRTALDMLELAVAYARMSCATEEEIQYVIEHAPDFVSDVLGAEATETKDGALLGEPGEWQRGYRALSPEGVA